MDPVLYWIRIHGRHGLYLDPEDIKLNRKQNFISKNLRARKCCIFFQKSFVCYCMLFFSSGSRCTFSVRNPGQETSYKIGVLMFYLLGRYRTVCKIRIWSRILINVKSRIRIRINSLWIRHTGREGSLFQCLQPREGGYGPEREREAGIKFCCSLI